MKTTIKEVRGIEVDHINGVIHITKSYMKLAQNPTTDEFQLLVETRKLCPSYDVKVKEIDKNENKESYNDLSIERMLAYVSVFETDKLDAFEDSVKVYVEKNDKLQKGKYATIKRVFLNRFKNGYIATIKDVENVVKIDEKVKELEEISEGYVGKMLGNKEKQKNDDNKVTDFPTEQKKVVNE